MKKKTRIYGLFEVARPHEQKLFNFLLISIPRYMYYLCT